LVDPGEDFQAGRREAVAQFNQAVTLNPRYTIAYFMRAITKYQLNDPQGALADYNQAISLNPQYANAYYNRGLLKDEKLNDRAGAIADFRTAAKLFRAQGQTQALQRVTDILKSLGATENP
jgi:tetratricopeptide (TPR) repeat protein